MDTKSINKLDSDLFHFRQMENIPSQHIESKKISIAKLDNDLFCFRMARGTPKSENAEMNCNQNQHEKDNEQIFEN